MLLLFAWDHWHLPSIISLSSKQFSKEQDVRKIPQKRCHNGRNKHTISKFTFTKLNTKILVISLRIKIVLLSHVCHTPLQAMLFVPTRKFFFVSDYGLPPNRRQVMTWTSDDCAHLQMNASLCLTVFSFGGNQCRWAILITTGSPMFQNWPCWIKWKVFLYVPNGNT